MSLKEKFKRQNEKSKAQMKQSRQDMKTAIQDGKEAVQQEKEKQAQKNACPSCESRNTTKQKRFSVGLIFLSILIMIVGTIFLGIFGFLIGSLIMIIPGVQLIQDAIKPQRQCGECKHIYTT